MFENSKNPEKEGKEMGLVIIFLGLGAVFFVVLGMSVVNKKEIPCLLLCFAFGAIFIYIAVYLLGNIPNGLPPELKTDGLYEIKVVDVYAEDEKGEQWVAFQVLKEQGNTITDRLPYKKIPKSKFGSANIIIGIPMVIELKTFPSQQWLAVK